MKSGLPSISPSEAHDHLLSGLNAHLLDVRSISEFENEHARQATLMPLERVDADSVRRQLGPAAGIKEPVYLICAAGMRAEQAARRLIAQGLDNLFVVEGGTDAWKRQQLPLFTHQKQSGFAGLSLQAQAQIFFGVLLTLFAIKSFIWHPAFILAVVVMGLLMVAAAIDRRWCPSKFLADLPWNKAS